MYYSSKFNFMLAGWFILVVFTLSGWSQSPTTYTWKGEKGHWNDPSRWTPDGVPGISDIAIFKRDTLVINSEVTIGTFIMTGGVLMGDALLTISDSMAWQGGKMMESGITDILPAAVLYISDTPHKSLFQRHLRNKGRILWEGSGEIKMNSNALIENQAGATFEIRNDRRIDFVLGTNGGKFTNAGLLLKNAGSGESQIDPIFLNTGMVKVSSGTLRFERGSSTEKSSGIFEIASGHFLDFSERRFILDGAAIRGQGTARIIDKATLDIRGTGLTLAEETRLLFNASQSNVEQGLLTGDGPITINGTLVWQEGIISGDGSLTIKGTLEIIDNKTRKLRGRTLSNQGILNWNGQGRIEMSDQAILHNQPGAHIRISDRAAFLSTELDGGQLINAGVLQYLIESDTLRILIPFENNGIIQADKGVLLLQGNSNFQNSVFKFNYNAALHFDKGVHQLDDVRFEGNGRIEISTNSVNANGNGVWIHRSVRLMLRNGILSGNGPLRIEGDFEWQGGKITGSDSLFFSGVLNMSGTDKELHQKHFINDGHIIWDDNSELRLREYALLKNNRDARFEIRSAKELDFSPPNGGRLENLGIVKKQKGSELTRIKVPFYNKGILDISSGILHFSRKLLNEAGATLQGSGSLEVSNDTTLVNHGILSPGASAGIFSIQGSFRHTPTARLAIEIGGVTPGSHHDQLQISGTTQLAGTLAISRLNGFKAAPGDTFEVLRYSAYSGQFTRLQSDAPESDISFFPLYTPTALKLLAVDRNCPPYAIERDIRTPEDTLVIFKVVCRNSPHHSAPLALKAFSEPAHGILTQPNDSMLSYLPAKDFYGPDSLQYTLESESGETSSGRIRITVTPVNDPPIFKDFPDSLFLKTADTSLTVWNYVMDPETPASALDFEFHSSGDTFKTHYNPTRGILTLSVLPELPKGKAVLHTRVRDEQSAITTRTEIIIDASINAIDPPNALVPSEIRLGQNYPNPFNPETTIHFELPAHHPVRLILYNILGEKIRTLLEQDLQAGRHAVHWDGTNAQGGLAGSGIYIYQLQVFHSGSGKQLFNQQRKMILLK